MTKSVEFFLPVNKEPCTKHPPFVICDITLNYILHKSFEKNHNDYITLGTRVAI